MTSGTLAIVRAVSVHVAPSSPHRTRAPRLTRWAAALLGLWCCTFAPGSAPREVAAEVAATPPTTSREVLRAQLDTLLANPLFQNAVIGVHVVDLETRTVLYEREAHLPLNPASNTKLATTAAALTVLGPEYRYSTRLYHEEGALQGSVVDGNLYMQGSGDPALVTEDLYAMVQRLRAQGVRRIKGGIVVDSTRFDRDELPPGFEQKDELAAYRAPSGATSVNYNTFEIRAHGGPTVGAGALVGLNPRTTNITVVNEAKTVAGRRQRLIADVGVERPQTVRISGSIGVDAAPGSYRYPVLDPSLHAGHVLLALLQQAGIKVGRSKVTLGAVPSAAQVLAVHYSAPLSVLIRGINKFSNNFMAEQVLKSLAPPGAPATFAAALERARGALESLGVDLRGVVMGNGSGLYDTNRYSAAHLTGILAAMFDDARYQADFVASLAIAGVDGTTSHRMGDSSAQRWVRVKTGTLSGISALAGYAGARNRSPVVFAIVFNGLSPHASATARRVQDQLAILLARYAAGEPLVEPAG